MRNYIIGLIILVIIVAGFLYFRNTSAQTTTLPSQAPAAGGQKLSDSQFANVSYQIYPGPLSSQAQQVTSDFTINTQPQSDGTVKIDLIPKEMEDQAQHFTLQPGQKLYFVEKNLSDDSTVDANLQDDMGIVVDAQGFIVQ